MSLLLARQSGGANVPAEEAPGLVTAFALAAAIIVGAAGEEFPGALPAEETPPAVALTLSVQTLSPVADEEFPAAHPTEEVPIGGLPRPPELALSVPSAAEELAQQVVATIVDEYAAPAYLADLPGVAHAERGEDEFTPPLASEEFAPPPVTATVTWSQVGVYGDEFAGSLPLDEIGTAPVGFDAHVASAPSSDEEFVGPVATEEFAAWSPSAVRVAFILEPNRDELWTSLPLEENALPPYALESRLASAATADEEFGGSHPNEEEPAWTPSIGRTAFLLEPSRDDAWASLPLEETTSAVTAFDVRIAFAPTSDEEFGAAHPTEESLAPSSVVSPRFFLVEPSRDEASPSLPFEEPAEAPRSADSSGRATFLADEEFPGAHPTEEVVPPPVFISSPAFALPSSAPEDLTSFPLEETTLLSASPRATGASLLAPDEEFPAAHPTEESAPTACASPRFSSLQAPLVADELATLPLEETVEISIAALGRVTYVSFQTPRNEEFPAAHPTEESATTAWASLRSATVQTAITPDELATLPLEETVEVNVAALGRVIVVSFAMPGDERAALVVEEESSGRSSLAPRRSPFAPPPPEEFQAFVPTPPPPPARVPTTVRARLTLGPGLIVIIPDRAPTPPPCVDDEDDVIDTCGVEVPDDEWSEAELSALAKKVPAHARDKTLHAWLSPLWKAAHKKKTATDFARDLLKATQHELAGASPLVRTTHLASAALLSGLRPALVAHGYRPGSLSHILVAIFADGRWHYADPRSGFELDQVTPFVEERFFAIPPLPLPHEKKIARPLIWTGALTVFSDEPERRIERAERKERMWRYLFGALAIAVLIAVLRKRPSEKPRPKRRRRR